MPTLDQMLPGPTVHDPVNQVISSEELRSLVGCLSTALSELESRVLSLYLDGYSYEQVGERLELRHARPSTTRCSGSSARSAPTSTRATSPL